MCSSLRVSRHPRGHVAQCNGRLELVSARVEQCKVGEGDAVTRAALAEARGRDERERKERRLQSFQREVRERVRKREKHKLLQVAAKSEEVVLSEQRAAQKAVTLEAQRRKPSGFTLPLGAVPDVDDAGITGSRIATEGEEGQPSASQLARRTLLAQVQGAKEQIVPTCTILRPHGAYHEVSRDSIHSDSGPGGDTTDQGKEHNDSRSHYRFTPVGRLERAERKQAGEQYLLFRRLYSDLEREEVRRRRQRRSHREQVERLKKEKEVDRRVVEEEVNRMDSFNSTVSSEAAEEREKAWQWAETVALEERRTKLQRMKENERYINALRGALKERLSQQEVPPLCSCGSSVWDAGPENCANNCVFYRNPRAYAKVLSNLLATLGT